MLNKTKNNRTQDNVTQAVIAADQKFILVKNINNFTDVISPFIKVKERYASRFILPINQLHRVNILYNLLSNISQYTVVNDKIKFDCVSGLPIDMFGDATDGYIHFSAIKKDKIETEVDPKLVFQNVEDEIFTFTRDYKIKFKSDYLKAFSVILNSGVMFSVVNKTTCKLYISVLNPSEGYIGESSRYEIINVIQYLMPLWPIFNIDISDSIKINFRQDFIQEYYKNEHEPILLLIKYSFDKPEEISMTKIGKNVFIEEV